jgi:hypothetical protein
MTTSLFCLFVRQIPIAGTILALNIGLANAQENKQLPITYISASAKLGDCSTINPKKTQFRCKVLINGVTNLPKGSILQIEIIDFIGQGSKTYNDSETVNVGSNGEFSIGIQALPGLQMRSNLMVGIAFFPNEQPAHITHQFGKRGENLNGPQIEGNAGGNYLDAITVVK